MGSCKVQFCYLKKCLSKLTKKMKLLYSNKTGMPDHIHIIIEVDTVKYMSKYLCDFKKHTNKEVINIKIIIKRIYENG